MLTGDKNEFFGDIGNNFMYSSNVICFCTYIYYMRSKPSALHFIDFSYKQQQQTLALLPLLFSKLHFGNSIYSLDVSPFHPYFCFF